MSSNLFVNHFAFLNVLIGIMCMTNDIMMWSSCLRDLFTLELEIAYIKFTKLFEDTNYLFVMYT